MQYAIVAMAAVKDLRKYPRFLVKILHWFHPAARHTRSLMKEAREMLIPIHSRQRHDEVQKHAADHTGKYCDTKPSTATSSVNWFEEIARGQAYDPTVAQLTFAVAAMHATTDLLCQVILDLARNPEIITALRQELIDVFSKEGWKQQSFGHLRLMDSVLKESQRIKPVSRGIFCPLSPLFDVTLPLICMPWSQH